MPSCLQIRFARSGDVIDRSHFASDRCTNPRCERWLPNSPEPVVLCSLTMRYVVNFCSKCCALEWVVPRAPGDYSILTIGDKLP